MPVLGLIRNAFERDQPFAGRTVAACLHVTAETAVLVNVLTAGGGRLHLAASNPLSTQDDIAAALAACPGVTVHARSGVDRRTYYQHIHRALDAGPGLVIDDGCDLVNTLHTERPELLAGVRGGCESTTDRRGQAAPDGGRGHARVPDGGGGRLAAPGACSTTSHGTGQSVIDGILRATNTLLAGQGRGGGRLRAAAAAGSPSAPGGSAPRSSSPRSTRSGPLDALMQGFRVLPMAQAAPLGQVFITATGSRDVIGARAHGGDARRGDPGQRRPLRCRGGRARRWPSSRSRSTRRSARTPTSTCCPTAGG